MKTRHRRHYSIVVTSFSIAIMILSTVNTINLVSIPLTSTTLEVSSHQVHSPFRPSQDPGYGTYVDWYQEQDTVNDEWTQNRMNWLFGPSPSFKIYHENESELTEDHYAQIDEKLNFSTVVPKSIIPMGRELGMVWFYGSGATSYSSENQSLFLLAFAPGEANVTEALGMPFPDWVIASAPWYGLANTFNMTKVQEEYMMTGQYNYTAGQMRENFLNLYTEECTNSTDQFNYYFNFISSFTDDTPRMIFQIGMMVFDDQWNQIASYNYASRSEIQGLAIGVPPGEAWSYSYGGSFTLHKTTLDGDDLYSVTRGADHVMRFNISGDAPEFVQMAFEVPTDVAIQVERLGWHWEIVTETGGWEFNETLGTYVWNATAEIVTEKYVYGNYTEYMYSNTGNYEEIWTRQLVWNDFLETYQVVNISTKVTKEFKIIYNSTTGFQTKYGYEYYEYPLETYTEGVWEERVEVIEDVPTDQELMYALNVSECSATQVGNQFVVEFVGHFTESMPRSQELGWNYRWDVDVIGPNERWYSPAIYGQNPLQNPSEYELAKQIIIESPVTLAKILTESGEEPMDWAFQADIGEKFQVLGRLQGGGPMEPDIDAVQLVLRAYDNRWDMEEERWSEILYEITIEKDGTQELRAFNSTRKYNWTYGLYWDYILTEKTGWYYEYNKTTDSWDWKYGTYEEWDWAQTEGWHWEHWYYNQRTGEWQRKWIEERSADAEISVTFCEISDFNWWTEEGDLYVNFFVNMTEDALQSEYWWEFAFASNDWHYDYASEYGEHEIVAWGEEAVYSFEFPLFSGNDVYVEPFNWQLAFYNDTLCAAEGVEYLKGDEQPYIVIGGETLPLDVREIYDPDSGSTSTEFFHYHHWDPDLDQEFYYYELDNGTEIIVGSDDVLYIFNVTLANDIHFLTAMDHQYYWDHGGTFNYYWIDIDGNLYQGEWMTHEAVSIELYDTVEFDYDSRKYFVRYGLNNRLNLSDDFRWDSRTQTYYMTDTDANLYELVYNSVEGYYMAYIGGMWQQVSWPETYYTPDYEGSKIMMVTWNERRSWYYDDGKVRHEMPYPGANAEYWHDLANTESYGGKVQSVRTVTLGGETVPVYWNDTDGNWFVDNDSTSYRLLEYSILYSTANGTEIWNPDFPGYTAPVGTIDHQLNFTLLETVWLEHDWPYDEGTYDYFNLNNGTVWMVNDSARVTIVYEYELDGKPFYTLWEYPDYFDNGTHWYHYYTALNGTLFEAPPWEDLPLLATHTVEIFYNGTYDVFDFMGTEYTTNYWGTSLNAYKVLNSTAGPGIYIVDDSSYDIEIMPIYQFNYSSTKVNATASYDFVSRLRTTWGYELIYSPAPIESTVYENYHTLVIGTPLWGMWGAQSWTTDPDTGALDLDGNLETEDDRYYVLESYTSTNYWNHTLDMMWVDIDWDPNGTIYGDEMVMHSWMGLNEFTWGYDWARTYYWYHADTQELLTPAEFDVVNQTVVNPDGYPRPGYWDISWMTKNETYQDYLEQAAEEGWDWVGSNEQTWTWLTFGVSQEYGLSFENTTHEQFIDIFMHYEFSGFFLWNDEGHDGEMYINPIDPGSGDLTHYFMPKSVGSIDFITPGLAYGDPSATGSIRVELDDEVTWGVTFYDINGTMYPYTEWGYWGWYEGRTSKNDMRTFDQRPTDVYLDELSFLVHFQGFVEETPDALNNQIRFKVDNYVGNWDVDMLGGRENLENRSLALNYLAEVSTDEYAFNADGEPVEGDQIYLADKFQFETAEVLFAEMIMGNTTYDWSKNMTAAYNVSSQTTPTTTFETAFATEIEKEGSLQTQSCTPWNFTESLFYVTIGFPSWDGYSVYQDPIFVGYVSTGGTNPVEFSGLGVDSGVPLEGELVTIGVDITSEIGINSVELEYSTDQAEWTAVDMTLSEGIHWQGYIPSHAEGVEVFYRVVVHTDVNDYVSNILSYIVGQAGVTTTGPTTTGPTPPPGELPFELMVMLIGSVVVIIVILVLVRRRNR